MDPASLLAACASWAPVGLLYLPAVAGWRLSTSEVRLPAHLGCDWVLAAALAAAALAIPAAQRPAPRPLQAALQALVVAAVAAACLRTFSRHVRGPRFRDVNMGGKVCIVTGANTGIGLETARELARMGATVVLACRSQARAEAAAADVMRSTGVRQERVPFIALDLSSLRSVRAFCDTFEHRRPGGGGLDVLVCNAGLMQPSRVVTEDGIELTMAANHFGHFLLIQRLLPLLERSRGGGRIVNVGSALAHNVAAFDFDDVMRCAAVSCACALSRRRPCVMIAGV